MSSFERYVGIDYSGAKTPTASLKGLRVYLAEGEAMPADVLPPPLLPPISREDIELLCWLGIESDGEGAPLQEVGSGK